MTRPLKRIAQLLRSVTPADLWQLIFLAGVILLFVSPRLPWWPPQSIESSAQGAINPIQALQNGRQEWSRFVLAMIWPLNLVGLAAVLTCFWPGSRPARRITFAVTIPAFCALAALSFKFANLPKSSGSIFAAQSTLGGMPREFFLGFSHVPPVLLFSIFGLLLISAFTLQLLRGKSSLPLSLPGSSVLDQDQSESWPQVKILIFILIGPLFLLVTIVSLPLAIPYLFTAYFRSPLYESIARVAAQLLVAALLVLLPVWVLREPGKMDVRKSLQLPEPRYAFFATIISAGACFSIPVAEYLLDRVQWAKHRIGRLGAPDLARYFDLSGIGDPWLLLLLFGAFAEEIVFRGVLLARLLKRYGTERGILLTGLIWAGYHFRADDYSGLSAGGVLWRLIHRIILCVAMNYVFAWMTLRWRSVIPASVAHGFWNILATSGVGGSSPWSSDFALVSWTVAGLVLYRFWPLPDGYSEPEPLAASRTSVS